MFLKKVNLIFVPFLNIALSFISLYVVFNWFFIKNYYGHSDLLIGLFYVLFPLFLPIIPILIWLRPKLKSLKIKESSFIYFGLVPWLAISIPTIISQFYIEKQINDLKEIENINQISSDNKYFSIKNLYLDKANTSFHYYDFLTGKYRDILHLNLLCAIPAFKDSIESKTTKCKVWLVINYSKYDDGLLSELYIQNKVFRDSIKREYIKENKLYFCSEKLNDFVFLENAMKSINLSEWDKLNYLKSTKKNLKLKSDECFVLIPKNNKFNQYSQVFLLSIILSFFIPTLVFLIMIHVTKLKE